MNHTGNMPTPERIMQTLTGFQQTMALKTGIELGIFTVIAEGKTTVEAIAAQVGASHRGIRTLCDYLTVIGFLTKSGNQYGLSPDSALFLDTHSPAYMGSISKFLASSNMAENFGQMEAIVRKGGSVNEHTGLDPEHPMWVEFARSMAPMMMMPAQLSAEVLAKDVQGPAKVLDIAAGHGLYGITYAQRNPQAQIVGLDWQNVLEVAIENAAKFGMADRYSTIKGSAFDEDFGSDYDIVMLPNFLHHFNTKTNTDLLRKTYAALKPGGKVSIVEFVPNEDRVSPPFPAMFSMMMLGGTPEGDAYTLSELTQMLSDAGFGAPTRTDLLPTPQTLLIATK